jgi:hypothetical protein
MGVDELHPDPIPVELRKGGLLPGPELFAAIDEILLTIGRSSP